MWEIAQAFNSRQNFWDISTYKKLLLIARPWDVVGHISVVSSRSLKISRRGERLRNFASNGAFGSVLDHSCTDLRPKTCFLRNPKIWPSEAHMTGFLSPKVRNKASWVTFGSKPTTEPIFTKIGLGGRTWVLRSLVEGLLCGFQSKIQDKNFPIELGPSKPWCSTKTDGNGNHVQGNWAYCGKCKQKFLCPSTCNKSTKRAQSWGDCNPPGFDSSRNGISDPRMRWTNNRLPFKISGSFTLSQKKRIRGSIQSQQTFQQDFQQSF